MKNSPWLLFLIAGVALPGLHAETVILQQPTATYSQAGPWNVDSMIDGDALTSGWAVQREDGYATAEIAVFETSQDVGFAGGTKLTFRLTTHFVNSDGPHNLGRFRLSITSDDRDSFADGLASDGDVAANWEVLEPDSYVAAGGAVLTKLPDGSLLASGTNADLETYTVVARTLAAITGVRLETLYDETLPHQGPGRAANGNFVLVNFTLSTELARADLVSSIQASCVEICWPGLANQLYQVQYSSALTAQWVNFGLPIHGNGTNCVTDSVRIAEHRFYRVIDAP